MLVIGGGPAGLMCAISALNAGAHVTILERNEKAGKKMYISGKGRCNLTNVAKGEDFLSNVARNGKFLYSSLYGLDSDKVRSFFEENGVPLKVERGGRVFPVSDKSSDVISALVKKVRVLGGEIVYDTLVLSVEKEENGFKVSTSKGAYFSNTVAIATGGLSYPLTGSTGDGYRFATALGHCVTPLKPALSAIFADTPQSLAGLTLKNVNASVYNGQKKIDEEFGEMLFTHKGVSGPVILTLSSRINHLDIAALRLAIDLKPALDENKLDERILRDFAENTNKNIGNVLPALMPRALIPVVLAQCGLQENREVNGITKTERRALGRTVKNLTFSLKTLAPIEEAIVTSGGVNVKEIDPKTMESKKVRGLYFAGEIIDYDCFTGGFNIQAAFSTGYAAGKYAAQREME